MVTRLTLSALILITGCLITGSLAQGPAATMQPARPGEVAIREEFDHARRVGTRAAYDFFLRRHGNHPLGKVAREERDRLATPRKR